LESEILEEAQRGFRIKAARFQNGEMCRISEGAYPKTSPKMNFERSEQLIPILDDLGTNDQTLFNSLQQKVLTDQSTRGLLICSQTVNLVFQALRDKLSERAETIVSEIRRVLTGAYIEEFDSLVEALKVEWNSRLQHGSS
jgi:hypothetical protein